LYVPCRAVEFSKGGWAYFGKEKIRKRSGLVAIPPLLFFFSAVALELTG
jgi:hypothetical protein